MIFCRVANRYMLLASSLLIPTSLLIDLFSIRQIDTLKQNLADQQSLYNSLTNEQQNYELRIEKLNKEHQQIIEELKSEFNQQEQIDHLNQQIISQSSQLNEKDEQLSTYKIQLDEQKNLQQQYNEKYFQLETKLNHILSEKADLENELDNTRLRIQTTESTLNEITNDNILNLEQKIKELQVCLLESFQSY